MNLGRFSFGIRTKINLGIIAIVLLSVVLIALAASQVVSRALMREYRHRGVSMALNMAARSEDAILALDLLRMKRLVIQTAAISQDILYAFILDHEGEVLSHTFTGGFPIQLRTANPVREGQQCTVRRLNDGHQDIYDFAAPVMVDEFQIGTIRLGLRHTQMVETVKELWWVLFIFALVAFLVADVAGFTLAHNFTSRIQALQQASQRLIEGHRGPLEEAPPNSAAAPDSGGSPARPRGDEIHQLAATFDSMTAAIERYIRQLAESKAVLAKSETKYRRIFEDSMDLIFVADRSGRLRDINPSGLMMLEYDQRGALLESGTMAGLLADAAEIAPIQEAVRRQGFVRDWECTLQTRGGRKLEVLLSMTARMDADGKVTEYEGIVKDITQRKQISRQLLQADRLASLGQLAAGVAHEINNPLGLILGYTQLLIRAESGDSSRRADLETIEKQTRNCKKIVEDLLNFARRTGTRLTAIDVNQAMEAVLDVIRHQLTLDNVVIHTDYANDLPPIEGDGEKLKQVFMNLLINAKQAIHKNGSIRVSSGLAPSNDQVWIAVADDGPGIAPDLMDKIFNPFFTTKPTGQGTGLGLSVSYGIVEDHGGRILVQSAPGQGATFKVVLPLTNSKESSQI